MSNPPRRAADAVVSLLMVPPLAPRRRAAPRRGRAVMAVSSSLFLAYDRIVRAATLRPLSYPAQGRARSRTENGGGPGEESLRPARRRVPRRVRFRVGGRYSSPSHI